MKVMEQRKNAMFQQGTSVKPVVVMQSNIGSEYTAVSLSRVKLGFPLSLEKPQKQEDQPQRTIKDCIAEVAKAVHGSLLSKEMLAKQIKQEHQISRKSIDQFMKDVVQRKKAVGDSKVRQLIDFAKIQEAPYSCDDGLL